MQLAGQLRILCVGISFGALLVSACAGLLGIEDMPLRPEDAGAADGLGGDGGGREDATADATIDGAGPSSAYAREVLTDTPLLYFRFGESGGAIAHDEMHRFDGAYPSFGVTFGVPGAIAGDPDGALLMTGQSKLTVPASADFAGAAPFSVEVWVKTSATSGNGFVIDHESWSGGRTGYELMVGSDGVGFERYASMTQNISITAPPFASGEWHHVLATWDGSVERVFIDGHVEAESGGGGTATIPAITEGWTIGGQNCSCSGNFYEGAIDELAIYPKVLGGERVQAHLKAAGR